MFIIIIILCNGVLSGKIGRGELRLSARSSSLESVKMYPKRDS